MNNDLLLLSKNDIPFTQAQVNIHQPTIKEISLISEESFHIGCQFLNFSINNLSREDKISLANKTDFEVFMSIMNNKEKAKYKVDTLLVLTLLFPNYQIVKISNFSTATNSLKIKKNRGVLKLIILNDTDRSFLNYTFTTNNSKIKPYYLRGFLNIEKKGLVLFSRFGDNSKNFPWFILLVR